MVTITALKLERTGLDRLVTGIISSHEFGRPKEDSAFWRALHGRYPYQNHTTLMVDDSFPVLDSAMEAGIEQCLAILAPDSQEKARPQHPAIPGIHHFDEVIPELYRQRPLPSGNASAL